MVRLRLLLPSLFLLACAATASPTSASERSCPDAVAAAEAIARQWDPREQQALHDAVARHGTQIQACALQAAAQHPLPVDPPAKATFLPGLDDRVFRSSSYRRRLETGTPPEHPFEEAFEQCLEPHVVAWGLPSTTSDNQFGFALEVLPPGAVEPSTDAACFTSAASTGLSSTVAQTEQARIQLSVAQMSSPLYLSGKNPRYTAEAREQGSSGKSTVRCTVDREGRLRNCEIRRSVPHMDEAVLDAMHTWCVQPVVCNGQRIESPFNFSIHLRPPSYR